MIQWRKEQGQENYHQYIVLEWDGECTCIAGQSKTVKRYNVGQPKDRTIKEICSVFCQASLGNEISGIFSNQEAFYEKVMEVARAQGEGIWRLPIDECYTSLLRRSEVADLTNYSFAGYAGASIAAGFLAEFAGKTPWVHLDVVGTAVAGKEKNGIAQGATGVMIRTLGKLFEVDLSAICMEGK